ncbi:hypothetical protein Syun_009747 [Stephania yunnanensis]|uniref:Uncharacterized protein n=1 Tax=Stephania yunnanensis TaxID=152371 RepID=A0AAP0KF37_9MAGN
MRPSALPSPAAGDWSLRSPKPSELWLPLSNRHSLVFELPILRSLEARIRGDDCGGDLFNHMSSVREVAELYGSEKSFVVEVQHALSGLRYTSLNALERLPDSPGHTSAYSFFDLLGAVELLELDSFGFSIIPSSLTNTSETPPTVNELYLHLYTVNHDGVTFIDTRLERFYLTQATPDQPVDDEAVYLNVAGECPKGRVYGLGSLGRKKMRYADPGVSTSQMPEMVPRTEFDIVAEQLRKVMAFMHQQFGMTMDGAGLSQP